MLNPNEKETLRTLANEYMEIASLPAQAQKMDLWKSLNEGRMVRPMTAIDQLPWHELNDDGSLTPRVEDPYWRAVEMFLRKETYKWRRFPADMVIEPVLPVPMVITGVDYGFPVVEETVALDKNNDVVGHRYLNQLIDDDDILKIKDMDIAYDEAETKNKLAEAEELFAGIIPVRPRGLQFHLGIWDKITGLMGVTEAYFSLCDRPEYVHRVLRRFTDATVKGIKKAAELNIYDGNANTCHCSYIYTDDLLPGVCAAQGMRPKDSWAYGLAQLFSSVSPDMTEEFELPYILEMAEHFGYIYYGCCDRLDDRIDLVKRIPNVRKVSCSPWSEREAFAERIGPKLTMSVKPSPAFLAGGSADFETVKKDLESYVNLAKRHNVNLEFILKDISTVRYEPERLTRWSDIALSVAGA